VKITNRWGYAETLGTDKHTYPSKNGSIAIPSGSRSECPEGFSQKDPSKPFFEIVFEKVFPWVFDLFFPFFCSQYLLASLRLKASLKRGFLRRFLGALCFHLLSVQSVCIWLSSFSSFSASVSCTPARPNACIGTPFSALFIAGLGSLSEKRNLKGSRGQKRLCDIMVLAIQYLRKRGEKKVGFLVWISLSWASLLAKNGLPKTDGTV
jgi:hypothetical protein